MNRKVFAMGLGVLLAIAGAAFAQIPTGTLNGTVTSAEGAPLPGVTVSVSSEALQGGRSAQTSSNGDYVIPYLPPGSYKVTFELESFGTLEQEVKVSSGQKTILAAEMAQASVSEEIVVTGSYETLSTTATKSVTYEKKFVEELPIARTIVGATVLTPGVSQTGPAGNISIAGNMSYENLFLVNGVVVNENLRGQAFDLFIEDAIEEITVSTSGISSEFGRFAGGVVNTITKSGGNDFNGSLRSSYTNDKWVSATPLTTIRIDKNNPVYEATLGGFFMRDKLWFFGAARDFDRNVAAQTAAPYNLSFDNADSQTRLEGKLTVSPFQGHRIVGTYLDIDEADGGNVFGAVLDRESVVTRELPQELKAFNYTGVISSNFFVEGQYSERKFAFVNSGSQFTDRVKGTLLINAAGQRWNSPTFCGVCIPEERNNENLLVKGSYFLSTDSLGSHQLTAGYDTFDDVRAADNHQSGSDYRLLSVNEVLHNGVLHPRIVGAPTGSAVTIIQFNPIFTSTQGNKFTTNSYYLNDAWQFNDRWSFNLGLRYDENDGSNQAGQAVVKDSKISPRLGLTWDAKGNGDWIFNASYGTYVAAIANNQADSTSSAGNPATFTWFYRGPSVNATGTPTVSTADALNILFAWFDSVGGPANTSPSILRSQNIPGGTTAIDGTLGSPDTDEYVLGVTRRLGSKGLMRADLVHRESNDFYMSRSAGKVTLTGGRVADFFILGNDNSLLRREYDGLHIDARYRFTDKLDVGGNYTLSRLEGNVNGETGPNGPVSSGKLQYPEYQAFAQNLSEGDLLGDQRHRAGIYARYRLLDREHHQLSVAGIQSYRSGTPYGASGNIDPRPYVTNPGYVTPPSAVNYNFTAIDAFRTDDITSTDLTVNYSFLFDAFGQGLEIFIQPEVLNVFNEDGVIGTNAAFFNTTILTPTTAGSGLTAFNPFTQTPVEGVNWKKGSQFGKATNPGAFQTPRTFRFSVGVRF